MTQCCKSCAETEAQFSCAPAKGISCEPVFLKHPLESVCNIKAYQLQNIYKFYISHNFFEILEET